MNLVILQGNLVDDVKVFTNQDSVQIVKGIIAISRNYGRKKEADYIPFTIMGNGVEYAKTYGKKGVRVIMRGTWNHSVYQDRNGVKRITDTCLADEFTFLIDKPSESESETLPQDISDDDLPF